jgi:choline dehydrogenase
MQNFGTFDYVIVGAGAAGCVLANRLSEDPATSVLLLEAGGRDSYIWVKIPAGYLYCMGNPRTDWCYKTEPEAGLNGRALDYARGKILGGCTAINGMIYMRGQARDYDHWRQLGNAGWAWDDVLPYFRRSEDHIGGASDLHGAGGAWRVEGQRLRWDLLDAFRDAAEQAGISRIDDFNTGNNEGVSYFQVNQRGGWRVSSATAFLRPVLARKNLTVMTDAQADRVLLEGRRATGVALRRAGVPGTVTARREVLLAAGAIGSPQLLQLSGIGPGDLLQAHGIAVAHEMPGVGENLQDHLQLRMVFKVEGVPTLNTRANSLFGRAGIALEYALTRSGPMAMAPSQLGVFTRSDPALETPDLEWHIQPLSLDKFGQPLHPFPAFTASVCHLRPQSRGHVRIVSPDPAAHPAIRPNYLAVESDRRAAVAGIRKTRDIVGRPALARYRPEEFRPGAAIESDAELARAAGDIGTTIFHPVGTARMGSDAGAVVDPELRVRGIAGLRVVDASVMPTITSGNTASPTVMIAEKAADMIRGRATRAVQTAA